MQNTGSSTWTSDYQLAFVSGDQMGAPSAISVPATSPGSTVDLSVNLTAPTTPGEYYGRWQLRNASGTYFGAPIWVKLRVGGGSGGNSPSGDIEILDISYPSVIEPGQTFRPEVTVKVNSGSLLESRGDLLRNTDGNLYGAWPHVAVQGSIGTGQTYTFRFYENNPIIAPNTPGTYTSKWRVWRDGGYVGPEIVIEFGTQPPEVLNKPPHPPSLVYPGDWSVFNGTSPTLKAQHNGDPDGDAIVAYYFDIFESHDIPKSGWISSNSWTPPGLGFWGYQWRVKVRDSRGAESGWSEVRHFNIENPEPQINNFSWQWCPPEWADGATDRICFCADTNAATLRLQVNRANDGSGNGEWQVLNESGAGSYECNSSDDRPPTWTQLGYEAGNHLVRLYARKDGGWEAAATRDLTINLPANRRPNKPFAQVPASGAYLNSRTVQFDWPDTLRTDNYRLLASLNADLSNPVLNVSLPAGTSQYSHTFADDYEHIYWQVTATGPYGSNESGSEFHIDIDPPSSAVQTLSATSLDSKVTVRWNGADARSGVRWYDVQIRDGLEGEWQDWLVNTGDTTAIFTGQTGHVYYFRSRAMDKIGNWETYPDGDGDTHTLIDPTAAPVTTWWNDGYAFKRNLIILNNDYQSTPIGYTVHLHFDASTTPTAQEIYDASQGNTKGDDVRVVYQNSLELHRFMQNFDPDAIDIWFTTQAGISVNGSDENNYQLYYGNSTAGSPPTDINSIFFPGTDGNTVGLWHFQEGDGSTVYDSSGRGHHGTFQGAGWSDGRFGRAGLFNGSNSVVNFGDQADFRLNAMTLEAWVLLNGSTSQYPHIFNKEEYWLRITGDRKPQAKIFGGEVSFNCPALDLNRWYHLAVTFNGSNDFRLYVNGQQCAQRTENRTAKHTNAPLKLGWTTNWPGTGYFPGKMQHVRISNIARTDFPFSRKANDPSVAAGSVISQTDSSGNGNADLVLQSLDTYPVDGQTFESGVIVQALVKNQGNASTINGFYSHFYVDHLPGGPNDFYRSIDFLVNEPVSAGQTITLTTVITDLTRLGSLSALSQLSAMEEASAILYSQIDSTGVVKEQNDTNNISTSGTEICVAGPDTHEGNDSPSTNNLLNLNDSQTHNFHARGDEDWLKIQATGGVDYTIETTSLGVNADTYLYLYDTNGTTLLASNDDVNGTLASQIVWTAPSSGNYYLVAKHWNPNIGGCHTGYTVLYYETQEGPPISSSSIYLPLILKQNVSAAPPSITPTPSPTPELTGESVFAAFNAVPVNGKSPLTVVFNDQSSGPVTGWQWNFGDGHMSTEKSPKHTYSTLGTFTVVLTVTGQISSDTRIKSNYITVGEVGPTADFSANQQTGDTPLTVSFTDLSSGPITDWLWNFGDGHTSNTQNPQHVYTSPGIYEVILSVTGPEGGATTVKSDYITVTGLADPTANFESTPVEGHIPLAVTFTDQSSGQVVGWQWDFGDGNSSTEQNPLHTYTDPGIYNVTLTVSGPSGADTEVKSNYITATTPAIFGDGSDGVLTVSGTEYTDDIRSAVNTIASAEQNIVSVQSTAGFGIGDEILIIQMQGDNAGVYEFGFVADINASTLTLQDNLQNTYTTGGNSKAQVIRVPHYQSVTVQNGGQLTAHAWNGSTGGIIAFRVVGNTIVDAGGSINVDTKGFLGGLTYRNEEGNDDAVTGQSGESYVGPKLNWLHTWSGEIPSSAASANAGGGAGGAGTRAPDRGAGGGGGSYGSAGTKGGDDSGAAGGLAGSRYGLADLGVIYLGSGGGGGGRGKDPSVPGAGDGGNGGGIVVIFSRLTTLKGSVSSRGGNGGNESSSNGAGGGGSGGSILIVSEQATLGNNLVSATPGNGGGNGNPGIGGSGGVGRIRVEYIVSLDGTTNPPASIVQFTP